MTQKVLIFTKKVLPNSNTFVAVQAKHLPHFQPIYIGFKKNQQAKTLIGEAEVRVQADYEKWATLKKLLLESAGYLSKNWSLALQAKQAALIHAHFGKGGFYCLPIAKKLQLPLVVTFHGSDITQKDKFSYSKKHRLKVFKQADRIIAVSKFIEKKLLEANCPPEKITQLYTGIDTTFFTPSQQKSTKPSLMFLGRLIKQKGCHLLIDAMKIVTQHITDVELIIVGDGVERSALEKQGAALPNIQFVGEKTSAQVKGYLDRAWVMCAPSIVRKRGNEEGLGSVFLEAQAMGTPVVSFNTGGVSEAVVHNQTGILLDEISSEALAKGLLRLLQNQALRQNFQNAGRAHITQHFNVINQSEKLARLYQEVMENFNCKS